MWTYRNASFYECLKIFMDRKIIFNSWHYSPTHSSHVSVDHELHKFVQGLILTKLLLVINLSYAKLWLMAAGFWWGCRCLDGMTKIESFCLISGLCVLCWENPRQQNPSPVFLPPCTQTETKMHNILTHKHTNTNWSWIHTAPKFTILCTLFHVIKKLFWMLIGQ